jgi:hypothetical protein
MTSRTEELLQQLEGNRAELRSALDQIPVDLRGQQPAPDRWSTAEVLEHLGILEGNITRLLSGLIAKVRAGEIVAGDPSSPAIATLDPDRLLDRSRRIVTTEAATPTGNIDADTAWQILEGTRQKLSEVLVDADDLLLDDAIFPHRVFGPLNVYQWITFVGYHEGRHAAQIREIGETLAGTTSATAIDA